ncbi:MAG: MotA/TolQ/ExbB proton channel family protein, partial [Planctomycetota bacterium]
MIRLQADLRWHVVLLAATGLVLAGMAGRLRCAYGAPGDFEQRLRSAIEDAQNEWRQESERIEREKATRRAQLEAVRATCRELADELVERKLAIARKQRALSELRGRRETLWTERAQWQEDVAEMALICGDAEKELRQLGKTAPTSEFRQEQNARLAQLADALTEGEPEETVSLTVGLIGSFLQQTRTSAVYESQIIDPRGRQREAKLLRVGQNLFAYRILGTSEAAIAISAPYEESGFRWHEQLPEKMRKLLVEAVEQAGGSGDPIWLPMDVTGQITATTNLSTRGLWDRLRSGGVVMLPLAFVALCLALLIADRFLVLLREGRHSLRFCDRVLGLCSQGQFGEAEQLAERTKGVLSRALKACLAHRDRPPAILDDAIQETLLHEFPKLERFLPSIRMLSAVAPMLGLL